jgi:hemolysin-activating ACP:hemolysin acyltransferase
MAATGSRAHLSRSEGEDGLRLVTGLPPPIALGRAVAHLMTKPAFAAAPFGHIARSLTGQVNRGHYAFVCRGRAVVGFAGWALATEPRAEAWLNGECGLADADATTGDCVVLNFWQADTPEVSRFIVARLAAAMPGKRRVYAKRHYPGGRVRPVRLAVRSRSGTTAPPN